MALDLVYPLENGILKYRTTNGGDTNEREAIAGGKPPRPKGGALTTPTPKIFCYPMKQLAHIRSKVTSQNPFPILRCPYQMILAIIDCVTGPSESHRMPPESICVSVV
jgi:hypothetical protein